MKTGINSFKWETIGQITVITLSIESLDVNTTPSAGAQVAEAIRCGGHILIDLGALRYFDVKGFVAILRWVAESPAGSVVRLCSRDSGIQALFDLLCAQSAVPLYRSREFALASFRHEDFMEPLTRDTVQDLHRGKRSA